MQALTYFRLGQLADTANEEKRLKAHSLRYFASVYHLQGDYSREVDSLLKSIEYLNYERANRGEVVPTYLALANAYEAMNQFVAKRFFSSFGIELTFANNGKEGYDQAFIAEYDLIFMDIQMPVWDGFIAAEKIRQDSMNVDTPIVALTADIQQGTVDKAKAVGMNDLITKPVTRDSIYSILSQFLAPDTSL